MKIYLAGPMRGIPHFNFPAFDYAAGVLRSEGHEVFSPAERDRSVHGDVVEKNETGDPATLPPACTIRECMQADTDYICREAEAIALLPGWEDSSGATAERALGVCIGAKIIVLDERYVDPHAPARPIKKPPGAPRRLLTGMSSEQRKQYPITTGVLDYFPDAIAMVAHISYLGNQKHNPGQALHWARGKSMDHEDCIARHTIERDAVEDGMLHAANRAWRSLAELQQILEKKHGLDLPRGATAE